MRAAARISLGAQRTARPTFAARFAPAFAALRRGRQRSGYSDCYAKSSVSLVEFAQQLLPQMSPRGLFYRATLGGYALLLRLTFAPCSRFHRLRHVPDLGPARADVLLFWFCVRIHECLALPLGDKNKRNRGVSRHKFIDRRFVVNK